MGTAKREGTNTAYTSERQYFLLPGSERIRIRLSNITTPFPRVKLIFLFILVEFNVLRRSQTVEDSECRKCEHQAEVKRNNCW